MSTSTSTTIASPCNIFYLLPLSLFYVVFIMTAVARLWRWPLNTLRALSEDVHAMEITLNKLGEEGRLGEKVPDVYRSRIDDLRAHTEAARTVYEGSTHREEFIKAMKYFPHKEVRRLLTDASQLRGDLQSHRE
ncbi:hypothetical protein C8Q78DRAFT_1080230 [Trametes maxima]|nr:hypothetical protein C8Q78DRAFT_1080230 [Trametes maxima]